LKLSISIARRACEAARARQAVVVAFDGAGMVGVASYGETKAECDAVKPTCEAILEALVHGDVPSPGEVCEPGARRRAVEVSEALLDRLHATGHAGAPFGHVVPVDAAVLVCLVRDARAMNIRRAASRAAMPEPGAAPKGDG
jgi:hypothetical protein